MPVRLAAFRQRVSVNERAMLDRWIADFGPACIDRLLFDDLQAPVYRSSSRPRAMSDQGLLDEPPEPDNDDLMED